MILLEMFFTYNKILAGINTLQCSREEIHRKDKRLKLYKTPSYSIRRIKATRTGEALGRLISVIKKLKTPRKGNTKLPTTHIILFIVAYFFQPWMVPFCLAIPFVLSAMYPRKQEIEFDSSAESTAGEVDIDDEISVMGGASWLKDVGDKMRKIQEMHFTAQIGLEILANLLESLENLFNFSVPFISTVALVVLLIATFLLYSFSLRYLILAWIVKNAVSKMTGAKRLSAGDFISFMSRVPDNEELEDYREL